MSVPTQDELKSTIAEKAGLSLTKVEEVLTGQGVSLVPVPPVNRSIDITRLTFNGTRTNTEWDGPFDKTIDFSYGVTAFITNENLRGKSSVLELVTWALRGKPRDLRSDVQPWFDRVTLEYAINGIPMAVILTREETGFVADVIRATDATTLRSYLTGKADPAVVNVVASGLSENQFAAFQDETMMSLLGFDPITNFQKHKGSDQGAARTNTWPAYYGGIHLPRNSDLLFGDTVFAGLPARILQMYCNVPLMGTYIRINTLTRVQRQDEANIARRATEDATARAGERATIQAELDALVIKLDALPSETGRSFAVVSAELRQAERDLDTAIAESREAGRTYEEARAARQEEVLRASRERETELAEVLFQGLNPAHCPRCEQKFEAKRTERELSDHECAVCTKDIPSGKEHDDDGTDDNEDAADALEALQTAEDAAKESASAASNAATDSRDLVVALAAELTTASQADEFTDRLQIQLEQSRLSGRLENFPDGQITSEPSETVRVLEAALEVLKDVTVEAAGQLFTELDDEILTIGRKLGIDNLDSVELNRNGGMSVVTAGVEEAFKNLSGGERVRLRVAVIAALLRVGHRSGVGSHPGLILLDSPGDELTVEAESTLLTELDSLKDELPTLQVLVASDEPRAVQGHLPEDHIYASVDGTPLW
ncbi:ATP-binding protein [Aeromicrobium endophyticum]|uniref:Large ATP-binding protein n=1 Tax=Aeromicrobium endophyticum TaxID=2292704 RepID=A0A371P9Z0_9ACTN|nr:ATP-binding protein [Aeromicrobium endophyticum]REK72745.1 hypothetical protein DX116_03850 [Aeromicrobium endophyticum]